MPKPLVILAIDDDHGDVEILRRVLSLHADARFELLHAANLDDAQMHLARPDIDAILVDYYLAAETGETVVRVMRTNGELRPIVVLTGSGNENAAAAVMRAGADDYLVKGELECHSLLQTITNARTRYTQRKYEVRNRELLRELQQAKAALEHNNAQLVAYNTRAREFVDHVSHEFRTPLTVIKEFASIMNDGLAGALNQEQSSYTQTIIARVNDLALLVDDMLDISKLEAGMLGIFREKLEVAALLQPVRSMLFQRAATMDVDLQIELDGKLPQIFGDAEKICRILINLIINAMKFCGDPGQVRLAISAGKNGRTVQFSVKDNGRGISAEEQQKLFQRFRQIENSGSRAVKGFGLGLTIVKELAHLNFSDVVVESHVGEGTTFAVNVPRADPASLIREYLNRRNSARSDETLISLTEVTLVDPTPKTDSKAVGRLLQRNVRSTDLVYPLFGRKWLLVTPMNDRDTTPIVARIRDAIEAANRDCSINAIPRIATESLGCWESATQTNDLMDQFELACSDRGVSVV